MKNKFMQRAIELSIESVNIGGGPFGSVIVKENKIISEGSNEVTLINDPTAHGEIVAIRQACKSLIILILVVANYIQHVSHALCVYLQFIGLALIKYIMQTQEMMLKKLILTIHSFIQNSKKILTKEKFLWFK